MSVEDYQQGSQRGELARLLVLGVAVAHPFWGLGNRNQGRRLTAQAIYNVLRRRAKEAGVKNLSPFGDAYPNGRLGNLKPNGVPNEQKTS